MLVGVGNSWMACNKRLGGWYPVEVMPNPAYSISLRANLNLSGLKTMPLSEHSLMYLTVFQNDVAMSSSHNSESSIIRTTRGNPTVMSSNLFV